MEIVQHDSSRSFPQTAITVSESSQIGEARRVAARFGEQSELSESERGRVAIIVTEVATNIVRYGSGGEILIRRVSCPGERGIEIIALDSGFGMNDLQTCMRDGFSTGGTPGNGLGAISRLATQFDVFSAPSRGTAIVARVVSDGQDGSNTRIGVQWSAVCIPVAGESECGDGWRVAQKPGIISIAVADGLGHGPMAATASEQALAAFDRASFDSPSVYLEKAHTAASKTRGAAVAMVRVNLSNRTLSSSGAGNLVSTIVGPERHQPLVSHNGTVGIRIRKPQDFEYGWHDDDLLVIHSDGLNTRWDLASYPGIFRRHAGLVAGLLYRDHRRVRDDATVVVARLKSSDAG